MPTIQEKAWLLTMVAPAQAAQAATGIPASVTLAQCILESSSPGKGWGQSQLALRANNYFGIKAVHFDDPDSYVEFPTAEYENGVRTMIEAEFVKYPDAAASFIDHARLLSVSPRYAPAMAVKNDPTQFAVALQRCGYSTSPTYAEMLGALISENNLTQYDEV